MLFESVNLSEICEDDNILRYKSLSVVDHDHHTRSQVPFC